jgi:hypothetical protein
MKITKADGTEVPGRVQIFNPSCTADPCPPGTVPSPIGGQGLGLTVNNQAVMWNSRDATDNCATFRTPPAAGPPPVPQGPLSCDPTKPGARLPAGAELKLTVSGVKSATTLPSPLGGVTFPPFTSTFTTANFRTSQLTRRCNNFGAPATPGGGGRFSNPECTNQGLGNGQIELSIDRAANQPIDTLAPGSNRRLWVWFDRPTDDVTPKAAGNITLQEVGGIKPPIAVTNVAAKISSRNQRPANTVYQLAVTDPAYPLKCNQPYRITASTNIKDDVGDALRADGCTPTAQNDCSDVRTFTTAPFAPQSYDALGDRIDVATTGTATIGPTKLTCKPSQPCLAVFFNGPLLASSVNASLTSIIKLFPQDANGNNGAAIDLTCPALPDDTQTQIVCQPKAALALNTKHLASAVFQQGDPTKSPPVPDSQAVVAATAFAGTGGTAGVPAQSMDQTSCRFKGAITRTFTTPCQ